jgi:secondary thiamine-phosphate synthase enzyme
LEVSLPAISPARWSSLTIETEGPVTYTNLGRLLIGALPGGVTDGLLYLFVGHTTCTLILNSGVDGTTLADIRLFIERVVPVDSPFVHTHDGAQDAAAHVRLLFGTSSLQIPIIDGELALGASQGIYLLELDGPRSRTVLHAVSRL